MDVPSRKLHITEKEGEMPAKSKTTTKTKDTGKTAERVGNVYTGGGDPENSLGETGDVYIRTSGPNREYHISEKRNGRWLKLVSLKGDKGDPGVPGDTGAQGVPGVAGNDGRDGQLTEEQRRLLFILAKEVRKNFSLSREENEFIQDIVERLQPQE